MRFSRSRTLAPSRLDDFRATGGSASLDFAGFGPQRIGLPLRLMNWPGTGWANVPSWASGPTELWAPRPADPVGLVTERTRQALWWLRHAARGTSRPSAPRSSFVSTPYIGHLKGVGKVWQITACDAASSYGIARILPALSALAVAHFLRASSPGRRVLT